MSSTTILGNARLVLVGRASHRPWTRPARLLGVTALLLVVSASAVRLVTVSSPAAEPDASGAAVATHAPERGEAAWVWTKRASRDNAVYAFGVR